MHINECDCEAPTSRRVSSMRGNTPPRTLEGLGDLGRITSDPISNNPCADWPGYLTKYPDVAASAQYGRSGGIGAKAHYLDWGYNEGRTPPLIASCLTASAPGSAYWDSFPPVVPQGGFKERTYSQQYGTGTSIQGPDRLVSKTLQITGAHGEGLTVTNPHYAPPGSIMTDAIMGQASAGAMKVTLPPLRDTSQAAWQEQRGTIPPFETYVLAPSGGMDYSYGAAQAPGKVYVTNAQAWLNMAASNQYGMAHGWLGKKSWMDSLSDAVGLAVQIVVVAGITAGVASAFGVGPLAQPSPAASAAASDAGMLPPPVSSAPVVAPNAVPAVTGGGSIATQAASGATVAPAAASVAAPAATTAAAVVAPNAIPAIVGKAAALVADATGVLSTVIGAKNLVDSITKKPDAPVVAPNAAPVVVASATDPTKMGMLIAGGVAGVLVLLSSMGKG